jgi:hypothetical protein
MGLLNEIYRSKVILNNTYTPTERADVKRHIIENSIYGVDVEKGAVDIARLRFWLSLIVDEERPTPLPNLEYKIVVGNSLVSRFEDEIIQIDWNVQHNTGGLFEQDLFEVKSKLLNEISKKQNKYFEPSQTNKEKLKLEIRNLKLDLLINQLQLMIEQSGVKYHDTGKKKTPKQIEAELQVEGWKRTLSKLKVLKEKPEKTFNHFDWKLDFPELLNPLLNGKDIGFDIVIANPPYIKEYTKKSAFDGFRNSPYYQGKMDLWYGFACVSIDLLKENGVECFIAQNNWITSAGASIFREKVLKETEIKIFTDFWDYKVFETAGIQTMIYLLKKDSSKEKYKLKYSLLQNKNATKHELANFLFFNSKHSYLINFNRFDFIDSLLHRYCM